MPKTFREDPKRFRSHTNKFKYGLKVKHDISEAIDNFASEDVENTLPSPEWCIFSFLYNKLKTKNHPLELFVIKYSLWQASGETSDYPV